MLSAERMAVFAYAVLMAAVWATVLSITDAPTWALAMTAIIVFNVIWTGGGDHAG